MVGICKLPWLVSLFTKPLINSIKIIIVLINTPIPKGSHIGSHSKMKFSKVFREKPGDDTGMQTRVWGPAGWLFLHSIAQNYPWKPTEEQKVNYLFFFKLVGNVLPCRYCRESYQGFIEDSDTQLNINVMKSRVTLVRWLYLIHNKVNKKLNISTSPTLKQVWDKYESFRSKCTKSPEIVEKIKTGCLDPLKGYRKKCVIDVI